MYPQYCFHDRSPMSSVMWTRHQQLDLALAFHRAVIARDINKNCQLNYATACVMYRLICYIKKRILKPEVKQELMYRLKVVKLLRGLKLKEKSIGATILSDSELIGKRIRSAVKILRENI